MSKLEQEFYNCLCQLLSGEEYIVQPKVCLSSVLEGAHKTFLNEIADFCMFNREYEPLLIIEINGEGATLFFRSGRRVSACAPLWKRRDCRA